MNVTQSLVFEVDLSTKDREAIKFLLDNKCEVKKAAHLVVEVVVEQKRKSPQEPTK